MRRTSVMLPDEVYDGLRRVAASQDRRLSDVVRDAAESFLAGKESRPARRFSFAAKGRSGTGDISLKAEEYLSSSLRKDHQREKRSSP